MWARLSDFIFLFLTEADVMRVLVVGASGLLGRGLVKAFTAAGHEVSASVRFREPCAEHV